MTDLIIPEVVIEKNTSGTKFRGRTINLIEGSGTTLTIVNAAGNRINVTIASTGAGGVDNFSYHRIDTGVTITVPDGQHMNVAESVKLDGTIVLTGDSQVFTGIL